MLLLETCSWGETKVVESLEVRNCDILERLYYEPLSPSHLLSVPELTIEYLSYFKDDTFPISFIVGSFNRITVTERIKAPFLV